MFQNLKLRTKLVAIVSPPLFILAVIAAYSVLLSSRGVESIDELTADIRTLGVVALASLLLSALTVLVIGRTITDPLETVARAARELADERLPALIETIKNPGSTAPGFEPLTGGSKNDEVGELIASLNAVQEGIAGLAVAQRNVVREGLTELVVNLARRNQSLLDRQIEVIDALESSEEDPDRLEELFGLDHLATRMRRNAESLLVVAGAESVRRRGGPVAIADVLRVAMSEIEDYRHVKLTSVEEAQIGAQGAVDLAHLFSEVLENATQFSPPDSPVEVTGVKHPEGSYLISCVDHGIGMTTEQLANANEVLANPPELGLGLTRSLGFIVVGRLAKRLGVNVELMHTASGGITAIAEVPAAVLAGGFPAADSPTALSAPPSEISEAPAAPAADASIPAPPMPQPTAAMPPAPTSAPAGFAMADEAMPPAPTSGPASFPIAEEEAWTPPAMPERGANPFGGASTESTPVEPVFVEPVFVEPVFVEADTAESAPAAAAFAAPVAAAPPIPPTPDMPNGDTPLPLDPPMTAEPAQSDALSKLLGLGSANLDTPPATTPAPTAPSTDSSMMFGRPVDEMPPAPPVDEPWTQPIFDPSALEVTAEHVAYDEPAAKLEDAIPTGESFDSGMESLLQPEGTRTASGLVKRDRSKNHAPVSEGRPVAASVRNPEEIRSMLARYRSGLKGKPLADLATPPMPTDPRPAPPGPPEGAQYDSFNPGPNGSDSLGSDPIGENTFNADAFQSDFDNNGEFS